MWPGRSSSSWSLNVDSFPLAEGGLYTCLDAATQNYITFTVYYNKIYQYYLKSGKMIIYVSTNVVLGIFLGIQNINIDILLTRNSVGLEKHSTENFSLFIKRS